MKLTQGRITDNGPIDQKEGSWRGGRNGLVSGQLGAITNEPGFDLLIQSVPGINIGNIVLDSNLVALFQINGSNSEIYIGNLTASTLRLITSNTDFQFNSAFPITGEYYRNSKGQIIISWTDNNMPPRVMNIEIDYSTAIDKLTRVYLKYTPAQLTASSILDTGGSLLAGAYFITTSYISVDESQTSYSTVLGPFYITDNVRSDIGPKYDGAKEGSPTSKSLSLQFSNVDTDYKYLVVSLVSKVGGVITAKQISKIAIVTSTINTTITGSENEGVISLSDIIVGNDVYTKVKAITQVSNQLIMANLSKEDEISHQLMALNVVVNYETTLIDITSTGNDNPKLDPTRGFMHNEVVGLYIYLIKDDGTITRGYHIPGRAVAVYNNGDHPEFNGLFENVLVTNAAGDHITRAVDIGGSNSKVFQFFNTADNPGASTNMQYWENEEVYPNSIEFGSLVGKPIRHHKFPSLGHIKAKNYNSDVTFGSSKLTRLNIKVSNVVLPDGYTGYLIGAAKRNFSNSTIIAQDLMQFVGKRSRGTSGDTNLYWTNSGNWKTSFQQDNGRNVMTNLTPDTSRIRIHAFDLLLDRPAVTPNYVEAEILIRNRDINNLYDFAAKTGSSILQSGGYYIAGHAAPAVATLQGVNLTEDQRNQDVLVLDETRANNSSQAITTEVQFPKKRFSKASNFKYLPSNVQGGLGEYMNLQAEECAVIQLSSDIYGFNGLTLNTYRNTGRRIPQFQAGVGAIGLPEEVTHLYNLKQYKKDMYLNMFEQDIYLIHKNVAIPADETSNISILGGDVLVSDCSYYNYGPLDPEDTNENSGTRVARRYVAETVNFASFRYQSSDELSFFFPETDPFPYLINIKKTVQHNLWAYNKDYTSVNDINSLPVNNPIENLDFNTKFPYRIIRSKINQVEEKGVNNWRTFPVKDYYEMPKFRGEITNIIGVGDNLIINQKYALYRTRNKIKLATSEGEVVAGSGDIFELPPEEMLPTKEGYAGCQHKSSCLLTKAGYFFVDAEQGKIFLLQDKLQEIARGNEIFFFNNLAGVNDNPYTDTGYIVGWDSEYNRILFGKTNGFTMSYSLDLEQGAWAFDHDYHPKSMFHTREGLFSFDETGSIFRHNSSTKKGIYYDDTIYPTSIVPVFNNPRELTKYAYGVKWRSEVRDQDDAIRRTESLTQLFIYNSFQATNLIQLSRYLSPSLDSYNLRLSAQTWHFNKFRDLIVDNTQPIVLNHLPLTGNVDVNKPFNLKRRFIDLYHLVNFIYDNQPIDGEQRNLYLYEVELDVKPIDK